MRRSSVALASVGAAAITGIALVVGAAHASKHAAGSPLTPPGAWRPLLFVGLIGAYVAYVAGCLFATRVRGGVVVAVVVGLTTQLAPLAGPMLLSTDATSYTTYGRAHQPYVLQHGWATASVYGPLWTFVSEPLARLSKPELAFRVLAAVSALAITGFAALLVANRAAAIVFISWNPLLALHAGGAGHNDALMMALVLAALVLERYGRIEFAGVAWAASIWIKWVTVIFWAAWVVLRRRRGDPAGLLGFAGMTAVLVGASFARFGMDWLHLFRTGSDEAKRTSSIGLLGWLSHLGASHREAVAVSLVALATVVAWLVVSAWRGRNRLPAGGSLTALAEGRLNPWFGTWGITLAGASEDTPARILSLVLTALLLSDVLPR